MTNAQHADNFVALNNGKYIDEDRNYGSQCWDVVAKYARTEFGCPSFPTISGGAEGLYRFFAMPIPSYFDKVAAADLAPGDVVVWSARFYPPYGHTALLWHREGNTLFVLEQDGSKDPNGDGIADGVSYIAQRQITSYIAGGLRPKNSDTIGIGAITMPSAAEVKSAFQQYGLDAPTAEQVTYYSTRPWNALLDDLLKFVYDNFTMKGDAVNFGFELAFGRQATPEEIAYWVRKNPSIFLAALYGSKTTGVPTTSQGAVTKDVVIDYLSKNLK